MRVVILQVLQPEVDDCIFGYENSDFREGRAHKASHHCMDKKELRVWGSSPLRQSHTMAVYSHTF